MNTEEADPHLTAKIVQGYVKHHRLGPDQLADLITSVHRAIGQLGQAPEPDEVLTPVCRCDGPSTGSMWSVLIAATEGGHCDDISAPGTV